MTNFEKVKDFMKIMGQEVKDEPTWLDEETTELRENLIREEVDEFEEAVSLHGFTLPDVAKELADILYVTYGAAAAYGIDLDKVFNAVHESNLTKLDGHGRPVYNDAGKVVKGPRYKKPDIEKVLYDE